MNFQHCSVFFLRACNRHLATLLLFIRLLSWLHYAFLAASSLTDCFRPAFCTSAMIGAYALRSSLLLMV